MFFKNTIAYLYLLLSLSVLSSCGDSKVGGYNYIGELDGTYNPAKEDVTIILKAYNNIVIKYYPKRGGDFWERDGKYHFDKEEKNILADFKDEKGPYMFQFRRGDLIWQVIDSTSIFERELSKFDRKRLEAKRKRNLNY